MTSPLVLSLAGVAVVTALFTVPAVRGSRAGVPASLSCRELRGGACRPGRLDTVEEVLESRELDLQADRPAGDRAGRSKPGHGYEHRRGECRVGDAGRSAANA